MSTMTQASDLPVSLPQLDEAGQALLFTDARTANTFAPTPVTDEELRSIWELAKWAPTAANTQPLRVLFVRTEDGRARLVEHMSEGNKDKVAHAPAIAVLATDTQFHEHLPELFPFRQGMKEWLDNDKGAHTHFSSFNSALQSAYFILAVRARGLAAGPMGGFDGPGIDSEFFRDGRYKTVLVVNIGHPGENAWFDRLPRLDPKDVLSFT
jgi:3-hydroxypropanoate dehydrogenase